MAVEYPDIISEYLDAQERYTVGGVQIVPSLEPDRLSLGGCSQLILLLQNALDAPVDLAFKLELPGAGRFRGGPALAAAETEFQAHLEAAQVAGLAVPLTTTADAHEGQYEIRIQVAAQASTKGQRVRSAQSTGHIDRELIDDISGLGLGRVLGVKYREVSGQKISLPITVRGTSQAQAPSLDTGVEFQSLWKVENDVVQARAVAEVNARRAAIVTALAPEPLFVGLFAEVQKRFKETGVEPRIGEAIGLAKILTYTVRYFIDHPTMQDGLLVPIWEMAQHLDLSTIDPIWIVRSVGFGHVARLAVALSFGLIAKVYGQQPWELEERQALIDLIGEKIETDDPLDMAFVYIPLLAGAAIVWRQVVMEGEDPRQSLRLLQAAKAERTSVFEDAALAEASHVFDELLQAGVE